MVIMTMARNEEGKGKGKGQRKGRNSCSSQVIGLPITTVEATTMQFSIIQRLVSPVCVSSQIFASDFPFY